MWEQDYDLQQSRARVYVLLSLPSNVSGKCLFYLKNIFKNASFFYKAENWLQELKNP